MADPTDLSPTDENLWYKLGKPGSLAHNSIEDAAAAAEYHFSKFSDLKNREHAAIIYRDTRDGKIYHTPLIGSGQNNTVPLSSVFENLPKEFTPLAVMHNHPDDPKDMPGLENRLSDADTNLGNKLNVRMFLLPPGKSVAEGTGQQRPYEWMDQRTKQHGKHNFQTVSPSLLNIPIDEYKQHIASTVLANPNLPLEYKAKILAGFYGQGQQASTGLMGAPQ